MDKYYLTRNGKPLLDLSDMEYKEIGILSRALSYNMYGLDVIQMEVSLTLPDEMELEEWFNFEDEINGQILLHTAAGNIPFNFNYYLDEDKLDIVGSEYYHPYSSLKEDMRIQLENYIRTTYGKKETKNENN